jgi:hypothetical protein
MTQVTTPPTSRQVAYITDLLATREVTEAVSAKYAKAVADNTFGKAEASRFITYLLRQPKVAVAPSQVAEVATTPVSAPAPVRELAHGFYTVADGQGGWVTLRIGAPAWAEGKTTIAFLYGADNTTKYKDFAFLTSEGVKVFRSQTTNHRVIAAAEFLLTGSVDEARAEFMNQAEAYAMKSNNCLCCLRVLTVPASVHRGLGPVCAKKYGWGL